MAWPHEKWRSDAATSLADPRRYRSYSAPNFSLRNASSLRIAAVMVVTRYTAISTATTMLFDAIASPTPMIDEPVYSGWPSQRYGPDEVTSRDLFRWPAAQMRRDSPAMATRLPHNSHQPVGCAKQSTRSPERNPSGARSRARGRAKSGTTTFCGRQTALDRGEHFFDFDIEQAHLLDLALPEMVTLANRCARHGLIVRQPGSVALGTRGTVDPDDWRADCCRDVRRSGVAGHHHHRRTGERDDVGHRGLRRENRRTSCGRHDVFCQIELARSPQDDRSQILPLAERHRQGAEPRRRPSLVRPRRAGIEQRERAAGGLGHLRSDARDHRFEWKFRRARIDADGVQHAKIDVDHMPRFARRVHPVAAWIVNVGVKHARQTFARVLAVEADHLRRSRQPRNDRGLDQALQIDRDVVARAPKAADRIQECGTATRTTAILGRQAAIDRRHE